MADEARTTLAIKALDYFRSANISGAESYCSFAKDGVDTRNAPAMTPPVGAGLGGGVRAEI